MRCAFNRKHFEDILDISLSSGYRFIGFQEFSKFKDQERKIILLRHDIDFSPASARVLAEIEYKKGIIGTYFFMLRSIFYNVMEKDTFKIIMDIIAMGHKIGLHFDEHFYNHIVIKENIIMQELALLENISGLKINYVSFHNPTEKVINKSFKGIINTYEKRFFKEIRYISDSNQNWRDRCICKILEERKEDEIQLLLHPFIWTDIRNLKIIKRLNLVLHMKKREMVRYLSEFNDIWKRQIK